MASMEERDENQKGVRAALKPSMKRNSKAQKGNRYDRETDKIRHMLVGLYPPGGDTVAWRQGGGRGFLVMLGPGHERN